MGSSSSTCGALVQRAINAPAPEPYLAPAVGVASASFGELLQGVLPDTEQHFLVTLPVNLYARADVLLRREPEFSINPAHKTKTLNFARLLCERLGYSGGLRIELETGIAEGKGLSSSTADIIAVSRAIAGALRLRLDPTLVCETVRNIEPTDGLMFEGCVSFYHRDVELRKQLGKLPPMALLGIDEGGVVDTVEYNRRDAPRDPAQMQRYEDLLLQLEAAVENGDTATIGKVATASALMNQRFNKKRSLPSLIDLSERCGGVGVVVGHSGTVAAILMDVNMPDFGRHYKECLGELCRLPGLVITCNSI